MIGDSVREQQLSSDRSSSPLQAQEGTKADAPSPRQAPNLSTVGGVESTSPATQGCWHGQGCTDSWSASVSPAVEWGQQ